MILVLDTSAAIEVVLQRNDAKQIGEKISEADWVISPDVYIAEITNVFWKYYQFGDLSLEICESAIDDSLAIVDDIVSSREFYKEAFALSCMTGHPVYDAMFLVLARRNNATLLTKDKKLIKLAKKSSIRVE
ncbi:MAG: type II toxin-antitoxin system VapC family toxin [Candidatus Latescibacteria bacterium]|nr:type II toxin-antitoxin system VapC family toxin [Candidatus Latescibacterota bacterium]